MQLIDICTNAIALFAALYFTAALVAHLHHCWQHPPVKPIAAAVEPLPPLLLLPPAAEFSDFSDGCFSSRKIEAIAPTVAFSDLVEASQKSQEIAVVKLPVAVEDAPHIEPDAPIDYQAMSSQQLRKVCGDRGIRWRGVKAGKHLNKPEMIAALRA